MSMLITLHASGRLFLFSRPKLGNLRTVGTHKISKTLCKKSIQTIRLSVRLPSSFFFLTNLLLGKEAKGEKASEREKNDTVRRRIINSPTLPTT